jgi:hypothetical protein
MRSHADRARLVAVVAVGVALLLQPGLALAQDPPPARAPEGGAAAEVAAPPDLPVEGRDRREELRDRWRDMEGLLGARSPLQMTVQGENVYVAYGTYILLLSAETLEVKAAVDIRELLAGKRGLPRERQRERPGREVPPPVEGEAAAEPARP